MCTILFLLLLLLRKDIRITSFGPPPAPAPPGQTFLVNLCSISVQRNIFYSFSFPSLLQGFARGTGHLRCGLQLWGVWTVWIWRWLWRWRGNSLVQNCPVLASRGRGLSRAVWFVPVSGNESGRFCSVQVLVLYVCVCWDECGYVLLADDPLLGALWCDIVEECQPLFSSSAW